jgi:branched-chain amino acid transport system ATP-binding protein
MMQKAVLRMSSARAKDDFVLVADGLSKTFDSFAAVNNVNLRVRKHSVHALIGPNGAGKTTCFNLLTKFLQPTTGSIWYRGEDITRETPENIANRGLVRSFQISAIFPRMSVRDNVKVALQRRLGISAHFWKPMSTLSSLDNDADELLEAVGLRAEAAEVAGRLSYGRKRALEIATTLALKPDTLLLDEPMAGLGAEDIEMVTNLIRQAAVGRTVLMVEHNLSVVARLADTITVLCRGEVLAEGSYETVSKNPEVISAYMGGSARA